MFNSSKQYFGVGLSACLLFMLLGCSDVSVVVATGDLTAATSASLERTLKKGLSEQSALPPPAFEAALPTGSSAGYTTTYTAEANVDEYDTVRYNGEYLFVAPERIYHCCLDAPLSGNIQAGPPPQPALRLYKTDPDHATAEQVGSIPLDTTQSVQGLYSFDDQLVVLTTNAFYGGFGGFWSNVGIWHGGKTGIMIYDVSNPASPQRQFSAVLEGTFVESRRVNNTVYLVSRHTPSVKGLQYPATDAAQAEANRQLLEQTTLSSLLPSVEINEETYPLVQPHQCYIATEESDESGYPVLTTVTGFDLTQPSNFTSTCYNQEASGVYVAEQSLYFTEPRHGTDQPTTRIHKFALTSPPTYTGSADVEGHVWRGGQMDFRMSERASDLRVMTTTWTDNASDRFDHKLFVLREDRNNKRLNVIGQLPATDSGEEIGKPNENLYGVRFFGDRAYAVTFEQIDPLYVIDLAQPDAPRLAGSVEVTGFSDFLHPVSDDLLLGLGRDASGGIKLELFNVEDMSAPISIGVDVIGGPGSHSEALYNRHAFTYQQDVAGVDRFVVPVNRLAEDGSYRFIDAGLHLYEIHDTQTPAATTMTHQGLFVPDTSGSWGANRHRSYLHGDSLFYVRDNDVFAGFWSNPRAINGPFTNAE